MTRIKWIGYVCQRCGLGIKHHGDWDFYCPECNYLNNIKNCIKLKEVI